MLTHADQPTDPYRPVLARYKGVIYPVNRVHSAWPGLLEEGKEGLNQPSMKDVFSMWKEHNGNPSRYPALSQIRDDSGDGMPEVNRPEEIDALIASVTAYLQDTEFDLAGKKVVWANDDRVYTSGTQWTPLPKHDFEASPYASVYKYSHDVAPARAALGVNGCTDCHRRDSPFFFASTVRYPFGPDGKPVTDPQHVLLQTGGALSALGGFREGGLKPLFYVLGLAMFCFAAGTAARGWARGKPSAARGIGWVVTAGAALLTLLVLLRSDLQGSVLPSRAALDGNHLLVGAAIFLAGLAALLREGGKGQEAEVGPQRPSAFRIVLAAGLGLCAVCGLLMLLAAGVAPAGSPRGTLPRSVAGAQAVMVAKLLREQRDALREPDELPWVRTIGRKTFVLRSGVWTDTAYRTETPGKEVLYASDAYFALLRAEPDLAQYLALGDKVIVVRQAEAIGVTTPNGTADTTPPAAKPEAAPPTAEAPAR